MTNIVDVPVGLQCNTLTVTGFYRKYRDWNDKSRILWRAVCSECNREMIVVPERMRCGRQWCLCSPQSKKTRGQRATTT